MGLFAGKKTEFERPGGLERGRKGGEERKRRGREIKENKVFKKRERMS